MIVHWVCNNCGWKEFQGLACAGCGSYSATAYREDGTVFAQRCVPDGPVCEGCRDLRSELDDLKRRIKELLK